MLYALATPIAFLGLLAGFVLGVTVHGWTQSLVAARLGDRQGRLAGRSSPDPRRHLDPFGAIAAAIAGVGWVRPVPMELRGLRSKGRWVTALLSCSVANLLVGAAFLAVYVAVGGSADTLRELSPGGVLQGDVFGPSGRFVLVEIGVSNIVLAVLSLVPLPPLDGSRILFGLGPRSIGWHRAQYRLVEQNWGVAVLLALLLIPLTGRQPLLLVLLDALSAPIVALLGGLA